jgi:hypothetical protein
MGLLYITNLLYLTNLINNAWTDRCTIVISVSSAYHLNVYIFKNVHTTRTEHWTQYRPVLLLERTPQDDYDFSGQNHYLARSGHEPRRGAVVDLDAKKNGVPVSCRVT